MTITKWTLVIENLETEEEANNLLASIQIPENAIPVIHQETYSDA